MTAFTDATARIAMAEFLHEKLTYEIRGAFYEVYNHLGPGHKETVYQRALAKEFRLRKLPFVEKRRLPVQFKGERVGTYEPDFIVDEKVLLEVKATPSPAKVHEVQLYSYLKGTDFQVGFLVNFGGEKIEIQRRIYDEKRQTVHLRKSASLSA